jgi:hypothetical protein
LGGGRCHLAGGFVSTDRCIRFVKVQYLQKSNSYFLPNISDFRLHTVFP